MSHPMSVGTPHLTSDPVEGSAPVGVARPEPNGHLGLGGELSVFPGGWVGHGVPGSIQPHEPARRVTKVNQRCCP